MKRLCLMPMASSMWRCRRVSSLIHHRGYSSLPPQVGDDPFMVTIKGLFADLTTKVDTIAKDVNDLKKDVNDLKHTNQYMVENTSRMSVENMFGRRFAKQFHAFSLADLVTLFKKDKEKLDVETRNQYEYDVAAKVLEIVPDFYNHIAEQVKMHGIQLHPFADLASLTQADVDSLKESLAKLKSLPGGVGPIGPRLEFVVDAVRSGGLTPNSSVLRSSTGIGLPAAIWAATGTLLTELEFDCRGDISGIVPSAEKSGVVTIRAGEIKSSMRGVDSAKKQLSVRLKTLRWVSKAVNRLQLADEKRSLTYLLIGHIFVLKINSIDETAHELSTDGISFYVHKL